MPVIRINAEGERAVLHGNVQPVGAVLGRFRGTRGPVIVMIPGFKYQPGHGDHCPHRHLLALSPGDGPYCAAGWPRQLGFGRGRADEGLGIAFGWDARCALWTAAARAQAAGRALADVLAQLHRQNPARPIHILGHSMGSAVALSALHHLPKGAVARVISLTGAIYATDALAALATPAGRGAEFFNITSRENDLFDFLYERLIQPPAPRDRALGAGLAAENAVNVQLDCPQTLAHLAARGVQVARPERRVCHWSAYTRPGVLRFYSQLLRDPARWPLAGLQAALPDGPAPRWSRLVARPALPLPFAGKVA